MTPTCLLLAWLLASAEPPATSEPEPTPAATPPAHRFYETATVRERPLDHATAAVSVLGREEIAAAPASTSLELLAGLPGVSVVSGGTAGSFSNVQLRGGDPNFTRVLIDGVAVNDGTYQVGEVFDFAGLPLAALERVEVVRGPLSAHFGSTGLAGVIQLFTRRGDDAPPLGLELGLGDADWRRAGLHSAAAGPRYDTFWHVAHQEEAERVAEESFRLDQLQGQFRCAPSASTNLRAAGRFADWRADDYPDASGGPLFGDGALRSGEHREAGASLSWSATGALAEHRLIGAWYRHTLDRESPAIFPEVPASVEATRFTRGRAAWTSSWRPSPRWQLGGGVDVERDQARNRSVLFLPPFLGGDVPGDYTRERTLKGAFGELLWQGDQLTLELSARQDWPEDEDETFSPRVGLAWQPGKGSLRVRGSWGRAYKLPSYFALASPPELGGNDALRPEHSVGADLALAGELGLGGGRLHGELGYFVQRYRDLVDFDFATFRHVNRGEVESRGFEGLADWSRGNFGLRLVFTHQQVEDTETGFGLRHRPRSAGQLMASWREGRLGLRADWRFVSSSLDQQIPVVDRFRVDGYHLVGLAASWELPAPRSRPRSRPRSHESRLVLRVDNLLDEEHETLIGFPGPGRGGRLLWSWSAAPRS